MEGQMKSENDYKKVRYTGNGRYKVFVEKKGLPGENYYFMSKDAKIFSVESLNNGSLKISGIRPSDEIIEQLRTIGAKMSGKLNVSVPWGAKIVQHNAQREPFFFGLFGAYTWEINDPDADPFIVIEL